MATSTRGSVNNVKEKRGTPLSSTIKKTLKPLSSTSSPNDGKTILPDAHKYVPNYIKPTVRSRLDPNNQSKKIGTEASTSKLTRTRLSFDRPPSSSQVQRMVRGSTTSGVVGSCDIKPQRSSSFSNKSTSSSSSSPTIVASQRLYSRTYKLKDGKVAPNLSKSRSLKKSNLSTSFKKEPISNYRKKAPKSLTFKSILYCDNRLSIDCLILEDDLVNLDNHEIQSLPEISEMPDINKELPDPINLEGEKEPKEIILEVVHHNDEDKSVIIDEVAIGTKLANPQRAESANVEARDDQVNKVVEDREKEVKEVEPTNTLVEEEKTEEEKETMLKESEKEEVEPIKAKDGKKIISSPVVDSIIPKKTTHPHASSIGKKDKQDYNHVIEETTTKLMGGRKNKVLAMAGAFETIISLQDSKKR